MASLRLFADRAEAGRRLAASLPSFDGDVVVLGLARGGVPVAAEVARTLEAPLDVLVVRKVGHPAQPEYALGAVSEDGVALPDDVPAEMVEPQLERARRQATELRRGRRREPLADRSVVVVDDGLATGRSMEVALATVDQHDPARVAMAVPVASGPGLRRLGRRWEVHAVEVLEPPDFMAVGQFYSDFSQVSDEEVARLLDAAGASGGGPTRSS
jgi:putative phosphoribosyl transferase